MNREKFTEKSLEALSRSVELASERQNQAIEPEHLLLALLTAEGGLIPELVTACGVSLEALKTVAAELCDALPKVSGGDTYISRDTDKLLRDAERAADGMKDEFVSVEHLMLGIFDSKGKIKEALDGVGLKKKQFLEELRKIRGNKRVTSENPESTYDVFNKYGQDLVALAREHKLDPIIGR